MGKIRFNRPEDTTENLRLTIIKLPTIGIIGKSKNGELEVCISADRKLRTVNMTEGLAQRANRKELEAAIFEAMTMALEGVEDMREAEFRGRLQNPDSFPWSTINEILP